MKNGNVILVAIDNSASAFKVTDYAIKIANALHKSLYFIHVINESTPKIQRNQQDSVEGPTIQSLSEFYLKECTKIAINNDVDHAFHSIIYGVTKRKLVAMSNTKNVSFTIIGATGYDDLYHNRIGHIAQYVSSWSKSTVTIVR
ncbi:universal stress protein [Lactiplantibacillus plantarum]|uniref:universal stress protein n=1 Tax=Lactiplantibacillus plantarum TaxID=1590 RepID=UPI0026521BDA|nr:universal stress protein [Lactiplantibacillus plantarum]MDN7088076.1 universal stress protein [Lactiplantibacillus plantarum]